MALNLRDTLAQLHEELGRSPAVDAESRQLLKQVSADIERLMHASEAGQAAGDPQAELPRLEALAVRFEADHPALAGSVRQVLDVLGRAGL